MRRSYRYRIGADMPHNFNLDDDSVVAELDASNVLVDAWEEGFDFVELGGADGRVPPLPDVRLCWLFHYLVDHVVKRDWDQVLSIGGLCIDVQPVLQRMISW